jgi:predicted CoA-binding protein
MRVMVIGASSDRRKFGNRAVRAYRRQGHDVIPVNPNEQTVEGLPAFATVLEPPGPIERALFYVPPEIGLVVMKQLVRRADVEEIWLNPGAESSALTALAEKHGRTVIQACAIVDIGERP